MKNHLNLLYDIVCCQVCTRIEWQGSKTETTGYYLFDSVMPTYAEYDSLWKRTGYVNPFEFKWECFEKSEIEYLKLVRESVQQQLELYGVDNTTQKSWIYGWFADFVKLVSNLEIALLTEDLEASQIKHA